MTRRKVLVASATGLALLLLVVGTVLMLHRSSPKPFAFERSGPVPVGGGGYMTGLSFSDDGKTRLSRTDSLGGYRWDPSVRGGPAGEEEGAWQQVASASTLPASEVAPGAGASLSALAASPSDHNIAYMATDNGVFRSADGARTWTRVLNGVATSSNDSFRTWGDRLVVDPVNPQVVYYGTQLGGLMVTRDGGGSWKRVAQSESARGVPAGIRIDVGKSGGKGALRPTYKDKQTKTRFATAGVDAIAIDRSGGRTGRGATARSKVLFASSFGHGLYRSTDGGDSWSRVSPAGMLAIEELRVLDNGDVLVLGRQSLTDRDSGTTVWRRHAGQWTDVTPDSTRANGKSAKWAAVAADPVDHGQVAMIANGGKIAISEDDGATWKVRGRRVDSGHDVGWLAPAMHGNYDFMSAGDIVFDPVRPGRLWFAEGTGIWYADLGTPAKSRRGAGKVTWHSQTRGIENLDPNGVIAPPGGKPVLSAWDRPLFRSESLSSYPDRYGPTAAFGSAWSTDWSVTDPSYLVASVASHQPPYDPATSGFSTDGGRTWESFPTIPGNSKNAVSTFGFGAIAVSTPGNVVWVPSYGKRPEYTLDGGRTWTPVTLPGVSDYGQIDPKPYYVSHQVLTADKHAPGTFYLFVTGEGVFRSTDKGRTWTRRSDDDPFRGTDFSWNCTLKAVPGSTGELYLSPGQLGAGKRKAGTSTAKHAEDHQPLMRSTDAGATWAKVSGISGVTAFGFGKAFPGTPHPAVFAAGRVDGVYGVYYSTDDSATWHHLTTYPNASTSTIKSIDGDKDTAGVAYVALSGNGWAYVDALSGSSPAARALG